MKAGPRPGLVEHLRNAVGSEEPWVRLAREVATSVVAVLLVGALLFAASGVWPPLVAVESGSMEPHLHRGDLVFVMEEHRLAPSFAAEGTGVVTAEVGKEANYRRFGAYGDVIVYRPDGGQATPVIHRAEFWVDEGENWYDRADPDAVRGDSCDAVPNCPAPHAGFVTKGDANSVYDQVADGPGGPISGPVRPAWVRGNAEGRIPWLGFVRLKFSELATSGLIVPAAPLQGTASW